ncbi:MAG: putative DNA binding domain-containing protein [Methanothrix sp.]|nr:putative DNA binding domain-containing protein [Methanothrix sp.]
MNEQELQQILEEGEGQKIEFKESLASLDKELVAFANASGGRILVGITDGRKIKGAKISNRLKSQVQDAANSCDPKIEIEMESFEDVLIIVVKEGVDKPYKCGSGFYRRVGPNSQKLSRNEIIEFLKDEEKIRFDDLRNSQFVYDEHFDSKKLDRFLRLAGISKVMDDQSILLNLGAAERLEDGRIIVNNTGILFFSRNLDYIYPHAAVTCALFQGTDKFTVLDRRDFNEDLMSNIDGAMNFLKRYIAVRYEMTGEARRREVPELPYDALREAIINAVAHRDYFQRGANVMVEVYDDRIEICNPGGLPKGLTPEEFGKRSVLRNPKIAGMLHRADYIEKMGTGVRKMQRLMSEAGLAPLEFAFTSFFTVTFRKAAANSEESSEITSEKFARNFGIKFGLKGDRLSRAVRILEILSGRERLIISQVAESFEVGERAITRDIKFLKDHGLVVFIGSPKTGWYVITENGMKLITNLNEGAEK